MDENELLEALVRANIGGTLDRRPKDPAGFPIDVNRPVIPNPMTGGERSTEFSRTIGMDGRNFNVPTIGNLFGKSEFLPTEQAIMAAMLRNKNAPLGLDETPNFSSQDEALRQAPMRSSAIGPARGLK